MHAVGARTTITLHICSWNIERSDDISYQNSTVSNRDYLGVPEPATSHDQGLHSNPSRFCTGLALHKIVPNFVPSGRLYGLVLALGERR
jgi:hypothetical protein